MDITLGQVVNSKAGRDAGRRFIIIGIVDEQYVLISDGDLRRLDNPKKKKVKHLELTGQVIENLRERLINKTRVTNSDIRKHLAMVEGQQES